MSLVTYHPVWEAQVSQAEKEKLQAFASLNQIKEHEFITVPYLIKHKKNGGIVATVLLQNGFNHSLHLNEIKVNLVNDSDKVIAQEIFHPDLIVPAHSAMPWSFVFSASSVLLGETVDTDTANIKIFQ